MEYTKGKWEAQWNEITGTWVIVEQPGVGLIARCGSGKGYEGNAHLIAAAPDMYDALEAIIYGEDSIPCYMAEIINKALAKAGGRHAT